MRTALVTLPLLLAVPAQAQELMELLSRGPVVLVENKANGKFDRATAVVHVDRPAEEVWKLAVDFANYKTWMPKVVASDAIKRAGRYNVSYEIDVPGVNTTYTFVYDIDEAKMSMQGKWVRGDIKDSFCEWRVVKQGAGCLVYYTAASRNFSSLAEGIDDDQQTVTVGVNVTAALAVVKAVKKKAEAPTPATAQAK